MATVDEGTLISLPDTSTTQRTATADTQNVPDSSQIGSAHDLRFTGNGGGFVHFEIYVLAQYPISCDF